MYTYRGTLGLTPQFSPPCFSTNVVSFATHCLVCCFTVTALACVCPLVTPGHHVVITLWRKTTRGSRGLGTAILDHRNLDALVSSLPVMSVGPKLPLLRELPPMQPTSRWHYSPQLVPVLCAVFFVRMGSLDGCDGQSHTLALSMWHSGEHGQRKSQIGAGDSGTWFSSQMSQSSIFLAQMGGSGAAEGLGRNSWTGM